MPWVFDPWFLTGYSPTVVDSMLDAVGQGTKQIAEINDEAILTELRRKPNYSGDGADIVITTTTAQTKKEIYFFVYGSALSSQILGRQVQSQLGGLV